MNRFKKLAVACSVPFFGALTALAEGTTQVLVEDPVPDWIDLVKDRMTSWVTDFAPLFTVGMSILLMFVGWKLLKRTTNRAG